MNIVFSLIIAIVFVVGFLLYSLLSDKNPPFKEGAPRFRGPADVHTKHVNASSEKTMRITMSFERGGKNHDIDFEGTPAECEVAKEWPSLVTTEYGQQRIRDFVADPAQEAWERTQ